MEVLEGCGLSEMENILRSSILHMGSLRGCSDDRGEAIMSVLDVTDWFAKGRNADLLKNI